jgi:hypothetical protein
MANNTAGTPNNENPTGEVPGDRSALAPAPQDSSPHESTLPSDAPHIVYNPPPLSRADIARQQRALRRMTRQRKAPAWVKKIPWILFPWYGFMRLHDPDYEEHYEQWREQEQRDYEER